MSTRDTLDTTCSLHHTPHNKETSQEATTSHFNLSIGITLSPKANDTPAKRKKAPATKKRYPTIDSGRSSHIYDAMSTPGDSLNAETEGLRTPRTRIVTDVANPIGMFMLKADSAALSRQCPMMESLTRSHISIQETQKYTFAVILRTQRQVYSLLRERSKPRVFVRHNLTNQIAILQEKCVRRLVQAGLGVCILDNDKPVDEKHGYTKQYTRNLCILINPKKDPELLLHEFKREIDEISIKQGQAIGRIGEESLDSIKDMCFSPALELQLTHNIIQNAFRDYDKDDGAVSCDKSLTVNDMVNDCFPLHDRKFNRQFFQEYQKQTLVFGMAKTTTGNQHRWAVEELRLHFGERVAFLFAFMHIYTKLLLPLLLLSCGYYVAMRFLPGFVWRKYLRGLAVIGLCVSCLWAPSFLLCWERETCLLVEKWNLTRYKNTVFEKNDSNPNFQYIWKRNEITNEMEKVPKKRNVYLIQVTMLFYVGFSAIVQCVCLLPFIQWYVYAKQAPTCSACHSSSNRSYPCIWFMTCFTAESSRLGTDRWMYILSQGVLLGLLIDIFFFELFNWISEKFVQWENCVRKSEYENRLIHRRFVFVWSNWFFWFLFLAFVYLPFGKQFMMALKKSPFQWLAPYDFDPTFLTLDTLFVTPLVVTQLLNMLLETVVPYLVRKLRGKPLFYKKSMLVKTCCEFTRKLGRVWNRSREEDHQVDTLEQEGSKRTVLSAKRLVAAVKQKTNFQVAVLSESDDGNRYTAHEIIAESKLPMFEPVDDYLDACIQFSYVVMFTVVWPLLPLPAFINNLLEVRGDAFRLLFAHRRPMPRRDTSIGEWTTVLSYANNIGITVVAALIVIYHFGYFSTSCNFTFSDGHVVPFSTINQTLASDPITCHNQIQEMKENAIVYQIVLFVVLEHIGFCVKYLILQLEKRPSQIRNSGYQRLKQIQDLTRKQSANTIQFKYICTLKRLFEKHDPDGLCYLKEAELIEFLADWLCKPSTDLQPYASIIFRYMDKTGIGGIPFSTCCLMLQHVQRDRFFSCLLGVYDPCNSQWNQTIRATTDAMEFRETMSRISSHRESSGTIPRDSSFFP
uniref:Transmembrane protein putative n=1 Tax=Albugo laibachii Nc14 TaxID=890382 RepID=F0WHJ7_9STRA|nr:transmembrane protein putative [Albugo laibachii Nc14]|eukprot:CCA20716.1 transmembrane protein putative [Albugo laibachii Nc14]